MNNDNRHECVICFQYGVFSKTCDTCYTNICEICRYKIDNCPFCYKRIDALLEKKFCFDCNMYWFLTEIAHIYN